MTVVQDESVVSADTLPDLQTVIKGVGPDKADVTIIHEPVLSQPEADPVNDGRTADAPGRSAGLDGPPEAPVAEIQTNEQVPQPHQDRHSSSALHEHDHADNTQRSSPDSPSRHNVRVSSEMSDPELQLAAQLGQDITHSLQTGLDENDTRDLEHVLIDHDVHDLDQNHAREEAIHNNLSHDQLREGHTQLQHNGDLFVIDQHNSLHRVLQDDHPAHVGQIEQEPFPSPTEEHQPRQEQELNDRPTTYTVPPQVPQHAHHQHSQQPFHPVNSPSNGIPERPASHYTAHDNIPPRKRSKVSRACDECRRKKVKCDAPVETSGESCSNCRKSNMTCLFSRIPQKRGPSKGYIKELADRINNIEGKLASEGNNADTINDLLGGVRRNSSDLYSPTDDSNRKRPYSSISGCGEFGTPSHQGGWTPDPRPIQPYSPGTAYSANRLAPRPLSQSAGDETPRGETSLDDLSLDIGHNREFRELNDDAFESYLAIVHHCYPLLSGSRERVELLLGHCPPLLRDAFTEALYGTMQSFVSIPGLYTDGDINTVSRLITEWESDTAPRSSTAQLVHLQTLILIAIATDNYGPPSLKGEHGGASKGSILGRAVGLAYSMRLHLSSLDTSRIDTELDLDCEENIRVRSWWTLVMLDRWNAIASACPLFIPNESVVLVPDMSLVLGEPVYHLARLSKILGHFAPVALAPPQVLGPTSGAAPILSSLLNLSIELFREVLPANITPATHPVLHLVYWHCRLLAYLYQATSKIPDLLWPCRQSTELLLTHTALLSPLNHHFFSLTTICLAEIAKIDSAREEADLHLRDLLDSNLAPSTWDAVIRERISDHFLQSTSAAPADGDLDRTADSKNPKVDFGSKTQPPDLNAVGSTSLHGGKPFDVQSIARAGYLNVLADLTAVGIHQ